MPSDLKSKVSTNTGWSSGVSAWLKKEVAERREAIGGIDNMWLLLSDVTDLNPVCAGTYTLEAPLKYEDLTQVALDMAKDFPRYKQRLTSRGRRWHGARFEEDPQFKIENHVRATILPEPAGKKELDDLVAKFIAKEWDLNRPLWEILLVENYHDEEGAKSAMITRAHHTLADGQGFVLSQMHMTSYYDELQDKVSKGVRKLQAARTGKLRPSQLSRSLRKLDGFTEHRVTAPLMQLFMILFYWIASLFLAITSFFRSTYQGFHQAFFFLLTSWRAEKVTVDYPGTRVKEREYSNSKTFSMVDVRLCQQAFSGARPGGFFSKLEQSTPISYGRAAHVTLNDVICSVMADIVGEELEAKEERGMGLRGWRKTLKRVLPSPIGFFIPISVRKPGDWSMRNLSTGSIVYLSPSEELSPSITNSELYSHIQQCRRELSLLKHSLWPRILFDLTQLTGQAPVIYPFPYTLTPEYFFGFIRNVVRDWVTIPLTNFFLESMPVILTNVPGPTRPLTIGNGPGPGVKVLKWTALPPQAGKGTIAIGILSYAGGISISVAADKVPGSEGVARRLCEKFEERFDIYVTKAKNALNASDESGDSE
ncbi:hypothetical protein M422DRAFT_23789 [Sphaerobolus stellatus SS14]|nr:hypothetical protein M422DRAFT_23789 [Sphaerobolus stellatus SS14]